ncbi:MAG: class I SAM-dependent methyltransferase [Magnetococcales bacterium]|nr:class I SAM-dependent methyltransferase [Magnetococcales bacterium]
MKKLQIDQPFLPPIWAQTQYLTPIAKKLAKEMGLRFIGKLDKHEDMYLALTDQQLELHSGKNSTQGPIFAEFIAGKMGYRRAQGLGRRELIGRAVGLKKGEPPTILDATPGLGRDGFILACLGCSVRLVERSVVVAALLQDGLKRALYDPATSNIIKNNISLEIADAKDIMALKKKPEDVVYLDPMYPHRTKSALVKKEMRSLRCVVGGDEDAESLLDCALKYAIKRVVVKRPHPSKPLADLKPDFTINGKKTRFDVYLTKND